MAFGSRPFVFYCRVPWAYLLRCADGTLYGGAAKDLAARLAQHDTGRASRYTRSRGPVTLAWARELSTWSDALKEEHRVKTLARAEKDALVADGTPSLTLLTRSSYREMPWKSGRGVTTEIARRPVGDGAFDWRISTAIVDEAGPFSVFPGLHRILVALEGEGLTLSHDGGDVITLPTLKPYAFSGDVATTGGPVGGAVRDFNVIWRRDRLNASVSVVRFSSTLPLEGLTLLYTANGAAAVIVPGAVSRIAEGETLVIDSDTSSAVVVRPEPDAILLHVALTPSAEDSGS